MSKTTHIKQESNLPGETFDEASVTQPFNDRKRLLNPVERISEILFGLIMALTFTCTISIAEGDTTEIRNTLYAAIGCNIAWGLVDAVMFVLASLAERGRNKTILHFIRNTQQVDVARQFIADALPPVVASVTSKERLEEIRSSLLNIPESRTKVSLSMDDFKTALGIFLLVFLSTFPVALPFLFVKEPHLAIRISNLVAIVLMFLCGWLLASYGGYNRIVTSLVLAVIGVSLVALTIALGG